MKYIKNNLDYAVTFPAVKEGQEQKFTFDCKRIYQDTGNVATTGVTALEDDDFDFLYTNNKQFKKFFDEGLLSKTAKSGANEAANKIDELAKENAELKEQLKKKQKEASDSDSAKLKKENEAKDAEINDLKAQLEALKRSKKGSKKADETEGF